MAENTTRMSRETRVGDNPPTTDQLFRLASHAMIAARQGKCFHAVRSRAYHSIKNTYFDNDLIDIAHLDRPARVNRRMAMRVGRRTLGGIPMKEWSLRFFDTSWYEGVNGAWTGVRNRYRFEWMRDTVTLAERHSYFAPHVETDMYSDLESLSIPDDTANILHAIQEMSEVTTADCEQLITEVGEYYK